KKCKEIKIFHGVPDIKVITGKIFYYPIPPLAFQGHPTEYKVSLTGSEALPKWFEYNSKTGTFQGLPISEDAGEYFLTLTALGNCYEGSSNVNINFHLHVLEDKLLPHVWMSGGQISTKHNIFSHQACTTQNSVTFAEIILFTTCCTEAKKRLVLISTMAEYLHLDPLLMTLSIYRNQSTLTLNDITILAEDISHVHLENSNNMEVYWPVSCGSFEMLSELIQVLRQNVNSGHLSQVLGYHIPAWRIFRKGEGEMKAQGRRQRRQLMLTPTPLITVMPPFIVTSVPVVPAYNYASTSGTLFSSSKKKIFSESIYFTVSSKGTSLSKEKHTMESLQILSKESISSRHSTVPQLPSLPFLMASSVNLVKTLIPRSAGLTPTITLTQYFTHSVSTLLQMPAYFSFSPSLALTDYNLTKSSLTTGFDSFFYPTTKLSGNVLEWWSHQLFIVLNSGIKDNKLISQGQSNTSPTVVKPIGLITATVGNPFNFSVPADTFFDQEDGGSRNLTLRVISIDGSPSGQESWVKLNQSQQILYGYPLETDFQYSPQEFMIIAMDSGGFTAQIVFMVELQKPNIAPCYLYTIRTKNSYHSFVKDRERVSLLLQKVASYLNDTNTQHISLFTLRPGSTVFSWYNSSL
uniref:Peptidase S72 domain-containing protein n=1 Tax=Latimeria chalumnae TaxID=7897 RepID=H3AFZ1_LATCH